MANPFALSSGGSNPFASSAVSEAPTPLPHTAKHGGHNGALGFVENLADDIRDAAVGIPTGLVQLVTHPVGTAEAIGKTTWHDWSPLFHGHVDQFAHQFYDHPLGPILDVATVFTGGAGALGKVAKIAAPESRIAKFAEAGKIEHAGVDARGVEKPTLSKYTSANPGTKSMQLAAHKVADIVGPHIPAFMHGASRYHRLELQMKAGRTAAMKTMISQFFAAADKMEGPDAHVFKPLILRRAHEQLQTHAFEHDPAKKLPENYAYVTARKGQNFYSAPNDMATEMKRFASRYTTTEVKHAATRNGKALIVPRSVPELLGTEGYNASKLMRVLYHNPTTLWKTLLLGYSPRYFVNNAVGNLLMYGMAQAGSHSVAAAIDAVRHIRGDGKALNSMRDSLKKAGYTSTRAEGVIAAQKSLNTNWRQRYFLDQLTNSHAYATGLGDPKLGEKTSKLRQGLFPITHKVSDRFIRAMALNAAMRKAPEVRALMKGGNKFDDAVTKALEDPKTGMDLRERVSHQINDVMGDYHTLGATERKIRDLVPFWTWQRHILRYSKNSALHRPGRTALTVQTGFQGTQKTEDILGQLPSYLKGVLPLALLGQKDHGGTAGILQTQGLNPFASLPDVIDSAMSGTRALVTGKPGELRVGETLGSNLNPLVQQVIERISGHQLLSDAPPQGGLVSGFVSSLPQVVLAKDLIGGAPKPKPNKTTGKVTPFLLSKDAGQQARSLGGFPTRQLNKQRAVDQYNKEHHIKKGRKKKEPPRVSN